MRRTLHALIVGILASPLAIAAIGCSDDGESTPPPADGGASDASSGTDGGATAEDAAVTTDSSTTTQDGGKKPFGETCAGDGECDSNTCFMGGKESYCSIKCTAANAATDCPKPPTSGECNKQGFCKK